MLYSRWLDFPRAFAGRLFFFLILTSLLRVAAGGLADGERFGVDAWLFGLRFDLAVAAVFGLLLTSAHALPWRTARGADTLVALLVLAQVGDLIYLLESGRHVSYEIFEFFSSAGALVGHATHYPQVFAVGLFVAAGTTWLLWRLFPTTRRPRASVVGCLASVLISLVLVRGGVTGVAMDPSFAQRAGGAREGVVALNGVYSMLYALATPARGVPPSPWPTLADEAARIAGFTATSDRREPGTGGERTAAANVVFVLLESWPARLMRSYGGEHDATPFFDRLRDQGLTVEEMLASGKRTTEGMFSLFCSHPIPNGRTVARSQVDVARWPCLPRLLRQQGWSSAFFQGSNEDTGGTGNFARAVGFAESFGKADIREKPSGENGWGAFDGDLYAFAEKKARAMPEPFLIGINTNTTHDQAIPAAETARFPSSIDNGAFLNALSSADRALAGFVEAMGRGFTRPVIFVLVADHTAHVRGSVFQQQRVPFLIYAPTLVERKRLPGVASHRDVAPTLADLLGLPMPSATGRSLLRHAPRRVADASFVGRGLWVEGDTLVDLVASGDFVGRSSCYDWRQDYEMTQPRACDESQLRDAVAWHAANYRVLLDGRPSEPASSARSSKGSPGLP